MLRSSSKQSGNIMMSAVLLWPVGDRRRWDSVKTWRSVWLRWSKAASARRSGWCLVPARELSTTASLVVRSTLCFALCHNLPQRRRWSVALSLFCTVPQSTAASSVVRSTLCSALCHNLLPLSICRPHRQDGWWRCTVVERRSLTGELSLSCARPAADGWPLM